MLADFKTLLRHSLIYGAGVALSRAVGFIMVPVYTRYLSTAQYGTLELLSKSGELLGLVGALGFISALPRFYYEYSEARMQRAVVSTGLILCFGVSCAIAAVLMPLGRWLSLLIIGDPAYAGLCRLLLVTVAFDIGVLLPLTYLRIERRSVLYTVVNVLRLVVSLSLNIYLIVGLRWGVAGALWSGAITTVTLSAALVTWTLARTGAHFDRRLAAGMARYGLPLIPASLCLLVIQASDRFFLGRLAGLPAVGVYSLGFKFGSMLQVLITGPLMLIWTTYIFEIAKRPDAPRVYGRALTYYALAATAFALPLSIFGRQLLQVVATVKFLPAYHVIAWVALGFTLAGAASIMEVGIYLKRRTELRALTMAVAAVVSLALNALLVPRLGAMGSAWALVGSYGSLAALTYLICRRLFPVPYELRRLLKLAVVVVAAYLAAEWMDALLMSGVTLAALKVALLCSVLPLLHALRFFLPTELAAVSRLLRRQPAEVSG